MLQLSKWTIFPWNFLFCLCNAIVKFNLELLKSSWRWLQLVKKVSSSKWLRWSSFLEGSVRVALPPLIIFFAKITRHPTHLILKFCLDFGNKNTKILLQVSGKRLTTCIIHYFSFTTHNYRMRTLQIQSWHKYSISGVFLSLATRIKML